MKKLTLIDNNNELKDLINEYGFKRVWLVDNQCKGTSLRTIEMLLCNWKDYWFRKLNEPFTEFKETDLIKNLPNYFDVYKKKKAKDHRISSLEAIKRMGEAMRKPVVEEEEKPVVVYKSFNINSTFFNEFSPKAIEKGWKFKKISIKVCDDPKKGWDMLIILSRKVKQTP